MMYVNIAYLILTHLCLIASKEYKSRNKTRVDNFKHGLSIEVVYKESQNSQVDGDNTNSKLYKNNIDWLDINKNNATVSESEFASLQKEIGRSDFNDDAAIVWVLKSKPPENEIETSDMYKDNATLSESLSSFLEKEIENLDAYKDNIPAAWDPELGFTDEEPESMIDPLTNVHYRNVKDKTIAPTTVSPEFALASGPLTNLIVNICDVIIKKFSNRKINRYFLILSAAIRGRGTEYYMKVVIRRLSKKLKSLSVYHGRILRREVKYFLKTFQQSKEKVSEFLLAINSIYSVYMASRMDKYVYDLKRFADNRLSLRKIRKRTRNIFKDVVFGKFSAQSEQIRRQIYMKFLQAMLEYKKSIE